MKYVILRLSLPCHICICRFRVVIGLQLGLEPYAHIKMAVLLKMRRSHFYITQMNHFGLLPCADTGEPAAAEPESEMQETTNV